jgi:hypothetical protein
MLLGVKNMPDFIEVMEYLKKGEDAKILPVFSGAELAKRWGVSRQAVNNWACRHTDFCKPIYGVVSGSTTYYPLFEVERYEKARGLNNGSSK